MATAAGDVMGQGHSEPRGCGANTCAKAGRRVRIKCAMSWAPLSPGRMGRAGAGRGRGSSGCGDKGLGAGLPSSEGVGGPRTGDQMYERSVG